MKKIMLLGILIVGLFLVGCAEEKSNEELELEMSELSDEELDAVIEMTESGEKGAVAGMAISVADYQTGMIAYKLKYERVIQGVESEKMGLPPGIKIEEKAGLPPGIKIEEKAGLPPGIKEGEAATIE